MLKIWNSDSLQGKRFFTLSLLICLFTHTQSFSAGLKMDDLMNSRKTSGVTSSAKGMALDDLMNEGAPSSAKSKKGTLPIKTKKIVYKGTYAQTTTVIPSIYYGTYIFTKEDTPGFDRTYHFNRDGTGYYKHNSTGAMETKKITQWGVLVENNKILKRNVKYYYWKDRRASGMVVAFVFSDGSASYNTFFLNDGKPCLFGPYGAVIEKSK